MLHLLQNKRWLFEQGYYAQLAPAFFKALHTGSKMNLYDFAGRPNHTRLLLKNEHAAEDQPNYLSLVFADADGRITPEVNARNSKAIINVIGPMTKYGDISSYGTDDYENQVEIAIQNPDVDALLLNMDTPGGAANDTFANKVAQANEQMPVLAFANPLLASAGYMVASQAERIYAGGNMAEIGSIGTYWMYMNEREFLEANGIRIEIFRADKSTDKVAINPIEDPPQEALARAQAETNYVNELFISAVKNGRRDPNERRRNRLKMNEKDSPLFTGRTYLAEDALRLGLIDAIGTFNDALAQLNRMVKKRKM